MNGTFAVAPALFGMALNPATAKVTDIQVSWDAAPVATGMGQIFWATVDIHYSLGGLSPCCSIRVPVACEGDIASESCRTQALQGARSLLNHACGAPAFSAGADPPVLEGLSQELGLSPPTTRSRRGVR
jgi:hypothetical protein